MLQGVVFANISLRIVVAIKLCTCSCVGQMSAR